MTTDPDEFTLFLDKLKHNRDELAVVSLSSLFFSQTFIQIVQFYNVISQKK